MMRASAVALVFASWLTACGAPHHSADDVAYMFTGFSAFSARMSGICEVLGERRTAPNLAGLSLTVDQCHEFGVNAQNLEDLTASSPLQLQGYKSTTSASKKDGTNQALDVQLTTEVWINESIVALGARLLAFADKFKDQVDVGSVKDSLVVGADITPKQVSTLPGAELLNLKVYLSQAPKFDLESKEFSVAVRITNDKVANIDNEIMISGTLVDDAFVTIIETTQDQPFEKSMLKGFKVLSVVTPYDNDVYVGSVVRMKLYTLGFAKATDSVLKTMISNSVALGIGFLNDQ